MRQIELKPCERIAIYGANSVLYLKALQTVWQQGGVAVLCPMRDPVSVIDEWLDFVDCHKVMVMNPGTEPFQSRHAQIFFHEEEGLADGFAFHPNAGTILRTSGSSSKPKSVFHTIEQHLANAKGAIAALGLDQKSRWLLSLPLYHVGGLGVVFRCWQAKAKVVVPPQKFELEGHIHEANISHISLVQAQLLRLLEKEKNLRALRRLKVIVLGGSAISPLLTKQMQELGIAVVRTYGMTEMASQITLTSLHESCPNLDSSGQLLPGRELKIGENQEILVKGPMLFSGYVEGSVLFPTRDADGWFHTGDRGFIDENLALHVLGRLDNMFISGGENIYPETIEKEILSYPDIEAVIVVARPHEKYGQCPIAFIKSKPPAVFNQAALVFYLAKRLAKFKIPKQFLPWPSDVPSNGIKVPRSWF